MMNLQGTKTGSLLTEFDVNARPLTSPVRTSVATKRRVEDEVPSISHPSTIKKVCRHVSSAISSGVAAIVHPFMPLTTQHPVEGEARLRERLIKLRVAELRRTSHLPHSGRRIHTIASASPSSRGITKSRSLQPRSVPPYAPLARHADGRVMESRHGSDTLSRFTTTPIVGKRKRETTGTFNMDIAKRVYSSFARSPWAGEPWAGNAQSVKAEKYNQSSKATEQLPTPEGSPTPDPDRARRSLSPSRSPVAWNSSHPVHKTDCHRSCEFQLSTLRDVSEDDAANGLAFDYRNSTPESEDERPYIQRILHPRKPKSTPSTKDGDNIVKIEDDELVPSTNLLKSSPSSEPIRPVPEHININVSSDGRVYDIKNDPVWLVLSPRPPHAPTRENRREQEARAQARRHKEALVEAEKRKASQEAEVDSTSDIEPTQGISPGGNDGPILTSELEKRDMPDTLKLETQEEQEVLKTPATKALAPMPRDNKYGTPKSKFFEVELTVKKTRRAEQLAQIEAARDQYRIVPLDQSWETKIKHAVRHGHTINQLANSKLTFDLKPTDLARLVPVYSSIGLSHDNWLNDESINAYMELLAAHGRQLDRPTQETPSHHSFNSFFYPKLASDGPKAISRWAKRAKVAGSNLLLVDRILIPINQKYHWTLAVLSGTNRTITVYNSLGSSSNATVAANLLAFVRAELGSQFHESDWKINPTGKSIQQTNADDCGVFTLTNARQLVLEKVPHETFTAGDIPCQRKRIVAELVAGRLLRAGEGVDGFLVGGGKR